MYDLTEWHVIILQLFLSCAIGLNTQCVATKLGNVWWYPQSDITHFFTPICVSVFVPNKLLLNWIAIFLNANRTTFNLLIVFKTAWPRSPGYYPALQRKKNLLRSSQFSLSFTLGELGRFPFDQKFRFEILEC